MAREVLYQGLLDIPVLYQDNSKDSLGYFRISQLPNEFTAGKNLFSFKCNPDTFLNNSPLYVEVLDSAGYPIYTEVHINAENDEQYAVVSVYVDSNTAPGNATIVLCGIIDKTTNGTDVNTNNGVNIRWQTPIQIYPSKRNTSEIVYSTLPSVSITSSVQSYVDYFYPGNGNRFTSSLHTGLNYLLYNNTAVLTTSSLSIPFKSDIVSGTIYISSSDISKLVPNISTETTILSESIASFIDSGSIALSNPLMIKQSNSNSYIEFRSATVNAKIVYEQTPNSSSLSSKQYNLITATFTNLAPLSGTVSRIKSYYKQLSVGQYILFNESDITLYESEYGYTTGSITLNLPLYNITNNSTVDFKFEFINPDGTPSNQIVYAKNYIVSSSCCASPNGPNYSLQYNNFGAFSGSGNFTLLNNNSVYLTGSLNISGSTVQIGNNTLTGNTLLTGSIIISGSTTVPASPTIKVYGDIETNGVIKFDPVSKNIDNSVSASYIYVSGSTNDLYFTQNGSGYSNTTRLRWLEGNLYSGLLNGGLITTQSSTVFQVQSGSGIIVNLNASTTNNPYPIIQYVNWPTLSSSISILSASYDQSFVAINSGSTITVQGTPYNDGDYNTKIPIGIVLHQNHSTINAVQTFPSVAYGWKQRSYDFIKAFGPLKINGYTLSASGSSTGSLVLSGGTSWVDGRNYTIDPNNPSYIVESTGITTSKIYRYYQSGSQWEYDTNNGVGYTTIDPSKYSNNGILTSVATNDWSIQRVFYFPNSATKALYIYYGNATYANKSDAIAGLLTETFTEAPNTAANAIFVGYMLLRYNADFTVAASYEFRSAGLFRSLGGGGSGGGGATSPGGSSTQIQYNNAGVFSGVPFLTYDGTSLKATGSFTGSFTGSLFGTSSVSVSSSYSYTASSAVSSSYSSQAGNSNTINISSFGSPVDSYLLMSNVVATTGVAIGGDSELRYNSSTNVLTVPSITSSFTGSLLGTASYSQTAISSSYAYTASSAVSSSYAFTASSAISSSWASSAFNAISSSYAFTASSAVSSSRAITSSFALTASYVNILNQNVIITGSLSLTNNITASIVSANNNGNGTNFKVGDDAWIGDVNIANTMQVMGQQDNTQGYIRFGSGGTNPVLGANNSSTLSLTGNLTTTGTINSVTLDNNSWASYGIVWSSDAVPPSLGNGTLEGYYKQIGKTVFIRVKLIFGTTTTGGTGNWYFSLPVNAAASYGIQLHGSILDNGNAWYQCTVNGQYGGFTDKTAIIVQSAGGANSSQGLTATFPFTFGNLDSVQFNGSYEAL